MKPNGRQKGPKGVMNETSKTRNPPTCETSLSDQVLTILAFEFANGGETSFEVAWGDGGTQRPMGPQAEKGVKFTLKV